TPAAAAALAGGAPPRGRSACPPATPPWSGRTTSPSRVLRPPSGTRPSPATGTPRQPSPADAASAATSTPPPPRASPRLTPLPPPSLASHGCHYRPSRPQPETAAPAYP